MSTEFLLIHPSELKFIFEVKKQCTCSVELINCIDQYVAFKVKTTSPKKYCVRPNMGVILPKATCVFSVIMQAQGTVPVDMQCKDKFLIQSTTVPYGSTDNDITPALFMKEDGRIVQEDKLKVVLVSPSHSPILSPINGMLKQEKMFETLAKKAAPWSEQTAKPLEVEPANVILPEKHEVLTTSGGTLQCGMVVKDTEELKSRVNILDTKVSELETKLIEAEETITLLREDNAVKMQERDTMKQDLEISRRKKQVMIQIGFPIRFVCFVALVCIYLGYAMHT